MNGSKRRFTVVRRIGKPHGEIVVRIFEIRQVNVDEPSNMRSVSTDSYPPQL